MIMDPELKQDAGSPELVTETTNGETTVINTEQPGVLATKSTSTNTFNASSEQLREIRDKISELLSDLPDYVSTFFREYKRPLTVVGLFIGAIITVKLTLAVLSAINDIPLLSPTFELIGFGYSIWFVYRYLLRAANRQELSEDLTALKDQVLGRGLD